MPRKDGRANNTCEPADAIDFGPLADWIGFNLRMAQAASFQAFAKLAKEVGSRPGRFGTLMLIGRNPGITQTVLSRANGRDKSTLTPVLNDLERRGLIRRQRTRSDQRIYRLSLTPGGREVLRQLIQCARQHERRLDRIVGNRDLAKFVQILKRIAVEAGSV